MERGESREFMALVAAEKPAGAANWKGGGKTNTAVATAGRSEFEQQDIEQAIMPAMSWPQSM
ncbi:MAG TPA: hypothetical protein VH110_08860 [Candidatus Acidoferrum sp.]|nr:hypothetical protein [Candidatus Acidoferrum sp.]